MEVWVAPGHNPEVNVVAQGGVGRAEIIVLGFAKSNMALRVAPG